MKTQRYLPMALALVGACGIRNASSVKDTELPIAQAGPATLGKGYDKEKQLFVGDCATGEESFVGAQEANLVFDRAISKEEMESSLGFSVNTRGRFGVVKGSAAASFTSKSSEDKYSDSTMYMAEYTFKNRYLKNATLSDLGRRMSGNATKFEGSCGHEYVEQVRLGARIYVSAKVDFATAEDKAKFKAKVNLKAPAFQVAGSLERVKNEFVGRASVTVSAFQMGGRVHLLSSIFAGLPGSSQDEVAGNLSAVVRCSMENLGDCQKVLVNALNYATNTSSPDAFPSQIDPALPSGAAGGPAELAYIAKPWSNLGYWSDPLITAAVADARRELADKFEENVAYRNRINAMKAGFSLPSEVAAAIDRANLDVAGNIQFIGDAATVCYDDQAKCLAARAEALAKLRPLSDISLEFNPPVIRDPYAAPASCPTGYVAVPGESTPGLGGVRNTAGVPGFCVAKYEMKHPTDATGAAMEARDNNATPESKPESVPWMSRTRDEARSACGRMVQSGYVFSLISNGEWQAVARNIERTSANWSGGSVGSGRIPHGLVWVWSDNGEDLVRGVSPADGEGVGEEKRTLRLSNGEVIWDFVSNIDEWISDNPAELGIDGDDILRRYGTSNSRLSERNRLLFGAQGYPDTVGFGRLEGPFCDAYAGLTRGGYGDSNAGLFSARLVLDRETFRTCHLPAGVPPLKFSKRGSSGFRCVARPSGQ